MYIRRICFLMLSFFLFSGCNTREEKKNNDAEKAAMIAAEIAFSKLSSEQGTRKALMQYIDSNGVLLRPNSFPMVGGDAINFISQSDDSSYTMIWQPKGGATAVSGELGYTYGIYSITPKDKDTVLHGTYINIWKKQPDGSWKLMLDSGNEGIEEPE
jgi:ketosteroid isomerase-like protein